jgi:hypothetical protein
VILHGTEPTTTGSSAWVNGRDTGKELDGYAQPALSASIELGTLRSREWEAGPPSSSRGANAASACRVSFGLDCVILRNPRSSCSSVAGVIQGGAPTAPAGSASSSAVNGHETRTKLVI